MVPVQLSSVLDADIYYENSAMSKILKAKPSDRYVKVQPGITLNELTKKLNKEFGNVSAVPLVYPSIIVDDKYREAVTLEHAIQENLLCL